MAGNAHANDDELYATIEAEAGDERESRATKELYQALVQHRKELSGEHELPADDQGFSEKVRAEAARRSAEITAYQRTSGRLPSAEGKPVPWWLITAWVLAIAAVAWAVWWFGLLGTATAA